LISGLTHASRNLLQRGRSGLERLSWRFKDQPELGDLVARARRSQEDLVRLFEQARELVLPPELDWQVVNLRDAWREGWLKALAGHPNPSASLHESPTLIETRCSGDPVRLTRAFNYLHEYLLEISPAPVRVEIDAEHEPLGDRPGLKISVRSNGPGITAEQARSLFQPFATEKPRSHHLGMAVARACVHAHGGTLAPLPGRTAGFILHLPRSRT